MAGRYGRIIKSLAGFYEVFDGQEVYRCRARGLFRAQGRKPLVGDRVLFEITDSVSLPREGNVTELLERKNELNRPDAANVDQVLVLFAFRDPVPSFNMLDRFLIHADMLSLPAVLCFNKEDLVSEEEKERVFRIYRNSGCPILSFCAQEPRTLAELRSVIAGKTSILTGPSGVGKSTLINSLCGGVRMETGELSRKIARGRNTTRHTELLSAGGDTYLIDTPGFTSLYLEGIEAGDLKAYYPEFGPYLDKCRFSGCLHDREPDCAVRTAVEEGLISAERYENYRMLYHDLKDRKRIY